MPTQTRLENGELPLPNKGTLQKIDRALQWNPGSAKSVMAGGEPVLLEDLERGRADAYDQRTANAMASSAESERAILHTINTEDLLAELGRRVVQLQEELHHERKIKEQVQDPRGEEGSGAGRTGASNTRAAESAAQYVAGTDPHQPDFDLAADRGPKLAKRRNEQWDDEIHAADPEGPPEGA